MERSGIVNITYVYIIQQLQYFEFTLSFLRFSTFCIFIFFFFSWLDLVPAVSTCPPSPVPGDGISYTCPSGVRCGAGESGLYGRSIRVSLAGVVGTPRPDTPILTTKQTEGVEAWKWTWHTQVAQDWWVSNPGADYLARVVENGNRVCRMWNRKWYS